MPDNNSNATKADLAALEERLLERMKVSTESLEERLLERIEKAETNLLRAFRNWPLARKPS